MSLEAQMKELTAALDRNTAALTGKAPAKAAPAAAPAAEAAAPAAEGKKAGPGRPAKPKITSDTVAEKANALKEEQGMPAVRALMKEHGSASGKIADLPKENYGAFVAAVDEALSGGEEAGEEDDESL